MPRIVLFGIVLFATALALLSIACGAEPLPTAAPAPAPTSTPIPTATPPPTATSTPEPTLAPTPAPLVFLPEDEAPHDAPVEWWYFNGMLTDDEGREYSYHFVTFQTPGPTGVTPHLLQATLGDHGRGVHYSAEMGLLAPEKPGAPGVDVANAGWVMRGDGNGYELRMVFGQGADDPTLELTALPEREPTLHGGTGLVHMGAEAGSTYYYSRTRLSVAGWLTLEGERRPAQGSAWMDHQWGDLARGKVGWDWASVQLDDGSDLMVAVVWSPEGGRRLSAHGTYIDPDGAVVYLHEDDFSITAQGAWRSPNTGIEYPMGWRVDAPYLELTLELAPYLENAEFDSKVLNVAYWEGAVSVTGRRGDQPVAGWGFVELAGYDPRLPEVAPPTPTQN